MTWKEKMVKGRRLNEKLASIINDYENGNPLQRLAARYQISYSWIWQRLNKLGILRKGGNRNPHYVNRRFGTFLVIRKLNKKAENGGTLWECRCDCGSIRQYTSGYLKKAKSCGCEQYAPSNCRDWEKRCLISKGMWEVITRNATVRNFGFNITKKQAWDIFISQKGRCALTGVALTFEDVSNLGTASLDRIDSLQGYHVANLQWVHKEINRMKGALSDEKFVAFCRQVVSHDETKKVLS